MLIRQYPRLHIPIVSTTLNSPCPRQPFIESRALVAGPSPPNPLPADAAYGPAGRPWPTRFSTASCFDFLWPSRLSKLSRTFGVWRWMPPPGWRTPGRPRQAMMKFHAQPHRLYAGIHHGHFPPGGRCLTLRRGVCQDYAHVMLGLCRSLKMPARYVSGYLADGKRPAPLTTLDRGVYLPRWAGTRWTRRTTGKSTALTSKSPVAAITPTCRRGRLL